MKLKSAFLLMALSLPLAGCGNKGPLVLPQAPVPAEESVPVEAPMDEVPADPVPTDAPDPAASAPPATSEPEPVSPGQAADG